MKFKKREIQPLTGQFFREHAGIITRIARIHRLTETIFDAKEMFS